ncbi:DUF488 domain-containing protein [Novimethylophilus kurashikiensis]|uniref:DUF488 domain-containing protein n=1 Tax=Novimethylophilus kurashikiensis TaxID=1825523 RepID=UPI000D59148F|nr:DUF488 domain-containing protein [Novimethylophilus kurashikiensis]
MAHRSPTVEKKPLLILTIGHSTHPIEEFIAWLQHNGVTHLLDVRTVPRSRRNPQFNRDTLPDTLQQVGIRYTHMEGLGGLRHTHSDSINTGWRNRSFRGYADYMQTQAFSDNVAQVMTYAESDLCALMCAEAVPWRCHRSLIGDALLVRGVRVEDIMTESERKPHRLTGFAKVHGVQVTYPAPPEATAALFGPAE